MLQYKKLIMVFTAFVVIVGARDAHAAAPTYGPDKVTPTAISSSRIDVAWTAVSADPAVSGYKIEREFPVGGGFTTIVANTNSTGLTYADTGLSQAATYGYRVSAINSEGTGPVSANSAAATTLGAPVISSPPDPPKNLTATPISSSQINLAWTAPADSSVTGYRIERGFDGGFTVIVANTNSLATSYADSNLSRGVTYDYRVSAINAYGAGNPSARVIAGTLVPPGASPQAVSAVAGDGAAIISWHPPLFTSANITGYRITGTPSGSAPTATSSSVSVGSTVTSTTVTGLTNGTTYYFTVSAVNAAGEGPAATTNTVTPRPVLATQAQLPAIATVPAPSSALAAPSSSAPSLQEQLNALMAKLQTLKTQAQGSVTATTSASPRMVTTTASETGVNFRFVFMLQQGMKGEAVTELQKRLAKEGFFDGTATGYFGQITKAAVQSYQRARGIQTLGIVGPATRASLNAI